MTPVAEGTIKLPALRYINFNNTTVNNVPASTATELTTITLPEDGVWLLITYMALSKSGSSVYNHVLGNRTVRSPEKNGGGSINVLAVNGNVGYPLKVYHEISGGCNITYGYQAFKIK